ncbi:MAG: SDR family oxidoreductase [Candidatus Sphingomonas phytovorans]|nr:SDR family NAD(P)-dependent oxidoreductase [Sphingomonas sp.]WEK02211.1 MAG: SDR family oxidoreductase [Sphingomonas sp.]
MGVLDGKTVIVTGAGNGIGKECALLAAREGASVIVNDLGSDLKGNDQGSNAAAAIVVDEIRGGGGNAVANFGNVASMTDVRAMVAQALDAFGGLHAIINPAGILRDGMFHKMADQDWDAVLDVHLRGAYNITRATVEHFRDQQEGGYVHFGSTSGLIGNLGQANYAAAKMGVAGLSRIVAIEGATKNIRSNLIAPFAFTRMVASIPVKDEASAQRVERMRAGMRADQVAQLAVALAAPAASAVSGQIFAARGNEIVLFSQPRPIRSLTRVEGWTPRSILDQAVPALAPAFTDLGVSQSVFSYDPV